MVMISHHCGVQQASQFHKVFISKTLEIVGSLQLPQLFPKYLSDSREPFGMTNTMSTVHLDSTFGSKINGKASTSMIVFQPRKITLAQNGNLG